MSVPGPAGGPPLRGRRPKAASGAGQYTTTPRIDSPLNLVHGDVRSAIEGRRNQIVFETGGPRVFIGVDADFDGSFSDFEAGDFVTTPEDEDFVVQIRVLDGAGDELHVIETRIDATLTRSVHVIDVPVTTDDFVYALTRSR